VSEPEQLQHKCWLQEALKIMIVAYNATLPHHHNLNDSKNLLEHEEHKNEDLSSETSVEGFFI